MGLLAAQVILFFGLQKNYPQNSKKNKRTMFFWTHLEYYQLLSILNQMSRNRFCRQQFAKQSHPCASANETNS